MSSFLFTSPLETLFFSYINLYAYESDKGMFSEMIVSPLETILTRYKLRIRTRNLGDT